MSFSLNNLFRPRQAAQPIHISPETVRLAANASSRTVPEQPSTQQVSPRTTDNSSTQQYRSAEGLANQQRFGDYRADSSTALEGGQWQFNAPRTPIEGAQINDRGSQLRGIGNNIADRALNARLAGSGREAEAQQLLSQLRNRMPTGAENRELNAYVNALTQRSEIDTNELMGVFNQANQMMNSTYPEALPNHEVMLSAIHDVAVPENISQRNVGTCAAGSAQMQMAMLNPQRYLNTVDQLASGGSVQVGNQTLAPNFSFLSESGANVYRTPSTALMQNAIMDAVDGDRAYTSAYIDITQMSESQQRNQGIAALGSDPNLGVMGTSGSQAMNNLSSLITHFTGNRLTHQNTTTSDGRGVDTERANTLVNQLQQNPPSSQRPVLAYMNWSQGETTDGGISHRVHAVNIIGIENDQVTILNPWGREERFGVDELRQRLRGALV